jgi:hypothetical protein
MSLFGIMTGPSAKPSPSATIVIPMVTPFFEGTLFDLWLERRGNEPQPVELATVTVARGEP